MNPPAYDLYREKNPSLDLARDRLEIDVCVQHNNGGLAVDCWWQSTALTGFFPVGEAAGAHGVYRPGGAALNSTQVGSMRAAQWIAARRQGEPLDMTAFAAVATPAVENAGAFLAHAGARIADGDPDNTGVLLARAQRLMSERAGLVRSAQGVRDALRRVRAMLTGLSDRMVVDLSSRRSVDRLFLLRDILTSQFVYLSAIDDYLRRGGVSRGSVLYTDAAGLLPEEGLPESMRYVLDDGALDEQVQEVALRYGADGEVAVEAAWRPRRPIPDTGDDFFENVWRDFREDGGVR
ncbi:FAD-binding protein [Actinomyces ruminis]|uniref:FAD-binding protein n=1 Tax=Actinomyces ruminis TaxID=1937003 RepID=UPI001C557AE5|nr:FAD-binding protein [Actinomyces ruminis]